MPEFFSWDFLAYVLLICTRWFKYDRDKLWLVYTQIVRHIWTTLYMEVMFIDQICDECEAAD
jgi:hypothetical protein